LVSRVNSFSIAMLSWSYQKRGALGLGWDICQVLVRNFDWLPFIPPLVVFSVPSRVLDYFDPSREY
jgi:hypothetical protein